MQNDILISNKETKKVSESENIPKMPKIELLGIGSSKNRELKQILETALAELGVKAPVLEVKDIQQFLNYDIVGIPALVVDGKVISQRVVPEIEELKSTLTNLFNYTNSLSSIKNILVPTDFSEHANKALEFAIEMANQLGSQITLLHTYKVYSTTGSFVSVGSYMEKDANRHMLELIKKYEPKLKEKGKVQSKIVRSESIARFIAKWADQSEIDLIIMGTQGASGLKEIFIGSTTNGVLRHTQTPVLAIPKNYQYRPIKSILFAVDHSGFSAPKVTLPLVKIARACQAKVKIYHADRGPGDEGIHPTVNLFLDGVEHSFHYDLDNNNIVDSINQFASDYHSDMLCLVRRKRGLLEDIFHVSITSREAFRSEIPLLVLHDD